MSSIVFKDHRSLKGSRTFIDDEMSSKRLRVQHLSWKQRKRKDPDINRATPTPFHPITHKHENLIAQPSSSNQVEVKSIKMGGDIM